MATDVVRVTFTIRQAQALLTFALAGEVEYGDASPDGLSARELRAGAEALRVLDVGINADPLHIEETCQRCGRPNMVWFVDNALWNRVMRHPSGLEVDEVRPGIVCPQCFDATAKERGLARAVWELRLDHGWFRTGAPRIPVVGLATWAKQYRRRPRRERHPTVARLLRLRMPDQPTVPTQQQGVAHIAGPVQPDNSQACSRCGQTLLGPIGPPPRKSRAWFVYGEGDVVQPDVDIDNPSLLRCEPEVPR